MTAELSTEPDQAHERRTILIVEDEVFIRLGLAEDLTDAGFSVLQAAHADEALQLLQTAIRVDLLITDIRMPGPMNGIDLAMQARTAWPHLKIMVISGNLADLPTGIPFDASVAKPYVPAVVIASIRQLLNECE